MYSWNTVSVCCSLQDILTKVVGLQCLLLSISLSSLHGVVKTGCTWGLQVQLTDSSWLLSLPARLLAIFDLFPCAGCNISLSSCSLQLPPCLLMVFVPAPVLHDLILPKMAKWIQGCLCVHRLPA